MPIDRAAGRLSRKAIYAIAACAAIALVGAIACVALSQRSREEAAAHNPASGRGYPRPRTQSLRGPVSARAKTPVKASAPLGSYRWQPQLAPIGAAPGGRARSSLAQLYGRDIGPSLEELATSYPNALSGGRRPLDLVEEADDSEEADPLAVFLTRALDDYTHYVDSYTTYDIGRDYMRVSMNYDGSGYLGVSVHALFKAPL